MLTLHAAVPDIGTFGPFFALRFLLGSYSSKWGDRSHDAYLSCLGIFECCVSPILIKIISAFYVRDEQAKRIGAFYVCNGFAQIFGGLLAYGITFYNGGQIAQWRVSCDQNS